MTRPFHFSEGEFYHIYNRGTDKRDVFLNVRDYERFTSLLFLANSSQAVDLKLQGRTLEKALGVERGEPIVAIGAYCLMPNHFHLLVREISNGGVSKFMQKLTTGYTMYFNQSNDRTGALFQGKFKAEHASEDRYLKYLFAYIHLNPAKLVEPEWRSLGVSARIEEYVQSYTYSSWQDYLGVQRPRVALLSPNEFPQYFSEKGSFEKEMTEWLHFNDTEQGSTL